MTTTYATDADVLQYDATASELLFDGTNGTVNDSGSFDRHRVITKRLIDTSLYNRSPHSQAVAGDVSVITCECYGVLGMAYRENASVAGERDRFWSLAQEYQRLYENSLENIKAIAEEYDEEESADETWGTSIDMERS